MRNGESAAKYFVIREILPEAHGHGVYQPHRWKYKFCGDTPTDQWCCLAGLTKVVERIHKHLHGKVVWMRPGEITERYHIAGGWDFLDGMSGE